MECCWSVSGHYSICPFTCMACEPWHHWREMGQPKFCDASAVVNLLAGAVPLWKLVFPPPPYRALHAEHNPTVEAERRLLLHVHSTLTDVSGAHPLQASAAVESDGRMSAEVTWSRVWDGELPLSVTQLPLRDADCGTNLLLGEACILGRATNHQCLRPGLRDMVLDMAILGRMPGLM